MLGRKSMEDKVLRIPLDYARLGWSVEMNRGGTAGRSRRLAAILLT
jgi:hypothetical protein